MIKKKNQLKRGLLPKSIYNEYSFLPENSGETQS